MIVLNASVVDAALAILGECGAGRAECLLYWVAPLGIERVDEVLHPDHESGPDWCEVDGAWATGCFLDLANRGRRIVAQLHTHPGRWVEPSPTDRAGVLVPTVGFLSLVVPHYARDGLHGVATWSLRPDGTWADAPQEIRWPNSASSSIAPSGS